MSNWHLQFAKEREQRGPDWAPDLLRSFLGMFDPTPAGNSGETSSNRRPSRVAGVRVSFASDTLVPVQEVPNMDSDSEDSDEDASTLTTEQSTDMRRLTSKARLLSADSFDFDTFEDDDDFKSAIGEEDAAELRASLSQHSEVDPLLLVQVEHEECAKYDETLAEVLAETYCEEDALLDAQEDIGSQALLSSPKSRGASMDFSESRRKSGNRSFRRSKSRQDVMRRVSSLNFLKARDELVNSERTYYGRLCILIDCFMDPLLSFATQELKSARQSAPRASTASALTQVTSSSEVIRPNSASLQKVHTLFGNVKALRELALQLLNELEQAMEENQHIGPVFVRMAPAFKIYSEYYQNFRRARQALLELQKEYWFSTFVSACEMQPHCSSLLLRDFLIEPVQRVPRYEILLRSMLRYTKKSQPGGYHDEVSKALQTVQEVLESLNQGLSLKDRRDQVDFLSSQWGVGFVSPDRLFVKSGVLIKTDRRGQCRRYSFVLFNDLFVYGEELPRRFFGIVGAAGYRMRFKTELEACAIITEDEVFSYSFGQQGIKEKEMEIVADDLRRGDSEDSKRSSSLTRNNNRGSGTSSTGSLPEEEARRRDLRARTLAEIGIQMDRVKNMDLDALSFMVESPGKSLLLTAKTVADKQEWVNAFRKAIGELHEIRERDARIASP